jgi:hypothetical protein
MTGQQSIRGARSFAGSALDTNAGNRATDSGRRPVIEINEETLIIKAFEGDSVVGSTDKEIRQEHNAKKNTFKRIQ